MEIAKELGVFRNTVSRMLKRTTIQEKKKRHRGSKLDPYRENIRSLIDEHNLSAIRILEEIREKDYPGSHTTAKRLYRELGKDRGIQAVHRYGTEPGKQFQVDFGEFGHIEID